MLGVLDATGYNFDSYVARRWPRFYRRNVIAERLRELAPGYAAWLARAGGEAPPLEESVAAEVAALVAEYETLRGGY